MTGLGAATKDAEPFRFRFCKLPMLSAFAGAFRGTACDKSFDEAPSRFVVPVGAWRGFPFGALGIGTDASPSSDGTSKTSEVPSGSIADFPVLFDDNAKADFVSCGFGTDRVGRPGVVARDVSVEVIDRCVCPLELVCFWPSVVRGAFCCDPMLVKLVD